MTRSVPSIPVATYIQLLRRWLWILVLCPLVATLTAGIVSRALPPIYEAHVSVLVRPAQPFGTDPNVATLTSDQISATYARLMTEWPLLERVIADLKLKASPDALAKEITVTPETGTTIIDVAVDDSDPARARNIANTLVADFIANLRTIQQQEVGNPNSRSADNFVVVAPAVTPTTAISPKLLQNMLLALAAGLGAALAIIFLIDYLDQTVKNDDDLTEKVGLTPIGHIDYFPASKGRRGELVALSHIPVAEAYKVLRTNLLFSSVDKTVRTVVVTSALPEEGKSRTAANLAIALAEAGHRTLLVDADFRRPSQHRIFGSVRNLGLSNLVLQDTPGDFLSSVTEVPQLWLLTSGPSPPNPSELLGSERMRWLIEQLRESFDYVVFDTPPVTAFTDASVLASYSDATILVVEPGRTPVPALSHALDSLNRVGAHVLGAVVNKVRAERGGYHYQYGYGAETVSPQATSANGGVSAGQAPSESIQRPASPPEGS